MLENYLDQALALAKAGQPFVLATVVRAEKPTSAKAGAKAIITADGKLTGWVGGSCAQPSVIRESLKALQDGQPRLLRLCPPEKLGRSDDGVIEIALTCISGGTLEVYIEPHLPKPQLIVVGHLPLAEALARLGKGMGYAVTVMGMDATPDRFPEADMVRDHIDFSQIKAAPQTYIVVASHGNYDEDALIAALKTDAPYIALVASKKRAESVIQYLRDSGIPEDRLSRLKYPAGLDIGAVTPEEIAISILAEIVQVGRQLLITNNQFPIATSAPVEVSEAKDPVCGMMVEIAGARYTTDYSGQTYYFCCAGCKRSFEKEPEKYLASIE
ncbi:MAG: XdhC family protein [Chloroflexi bacterium]|nr:XdhC family protein [Chloroflexota bacterium]